MGAGSPINRCKLVEIVESCARKRCYEVTPVLIKFSITNLHSVCVFVDNTNYVTSLNNFIRTRTERFTKRLFNFNNISIKSLFYSNRGFASKKLT